MEDELLFPLVIPHSYDLISEACINAIPTSLAAWEVLAPNSNSISVAMGCEDGSIYIFHPESIFSPSIETNTLDSGVLAKLQPPMSPRQPLLTNLSRFHGPPSPSASSNHSSVMSTPAGHKYASFQPSKSRASAGVSKEQVEAPKNHVDYDQEPAKLKSLLKARELPKERGFIEGFIPSLKMGHHHYHHRPGSSEGQQSKLERHPSYSQTSTNPASSTSTSPPASPTGPRMMRSSDGFTGSYRLKLAVHAFPPRFGFGRAITQLQPLEDGMLLASLQECGTVGIYSTADGQCLSSIQISATTPINPPSGAPHVESGSKAVWKWEKMVLGTVAETTFLLLAASDSTTVWDAPIPRTRVTVVEVKGTTQRKFSQPSDYLTKIGEWVVDSVVDNVGITADSSGIPSFYYLSSSKRISFYRIRILEKVRLAMPTLPPVEDVTPTSINLPGTTIPIPNPFKHRRPRLARPLSVYDLRKTEEGLVELEHSLDLFDPSFEFEDDFRIIPRKLVLDEPVVTYTENVVRVFVLKDAGLVLVDKFQSEDVHSVLLVSLDLLLVRTEIQNSLYQIRKDGDIVLLSNGEVNISPPNSICTTVGSSIVSTSIGSSGGRRLKLLNLSPNISKPQRLWRSSLPTTKALKIVSLLPIEIDNIVVGCDDGYLRRTSLGKLVRQGDKSLLSSPLSDQPLNGAVVCLRLLKNERSGEYFIVGGSDAGVVAIWNSQTLRLLGRWTLFATPLMSVIGLNDETVGRLKEHVLCVATGGTVAVLYLDGLEVSCLIPGGPDRLEKIALGEDNLMLIYANDMARIWDVRTQEFWRSMPRDKAEEVLEQGGWFEALVEPEGPLFTSPIVGCAERSFATSDGAATLILNVRNLISVFNPNHVLLASSNSQPDTPDKHAQISERQTEAFPSFISTILTFGLDESIDDRICDAFGIDATTTSCGSCGFGNTPSIAVQSSASAVWALSSEYTTWRLLCICVLLRVGLGIEEISKDMNTALVYYTASLFEAIGKQYRRPSLEILVRFWFDSNAEIRMTARSLFDATVGQLSDDEVVSITTELQHRLPTLQPDIHKESEYAVVALMVVGNIAIARHASLSPGIFTDVAASIALYLHDESSAHRVVAIDLSSRGLQIWQAYTDTMEILRSLFELSTASRKDNDIPSIRNPGAQARLAVLHIAGTNGHLFMTKLLLDILQPRTSDHSLAIMHLLAFLIRKKPLVLYSSLSRLMEAVVKTMDPSSSFRDTILDAVTSIIGEVVKTYPTVDFHTASQKLVVGTPEGAAVLYDLKTATRLYVLEGHKKRLAACSFSPDGRRLVTLSLEESVVMVWKVGSSFTSFFYPGAPPRQGNSGSDPYKTLSFNVGSEAHMTTAATLEWVSFDWPADRTAKLRIRDSILTFDTT